MLDAWRRRRDRSRVQSEARHLIDEAQGILRRRRAEIPDAVHRDMDNSIAEVRAALAEPESDLEAARDAVARLDGKIDEHLKFARKSTAREYAESIGIAVTIAMLLRFFVVEAFQIPSGSMIPTLQVGDHIFVSKFSYSIGLPLREKKIIKYGLPRRGDVIVFKFPENQSLDYIKRVVALPGETIEVRRNEIFINGKAMPRSHVAGPCSYEDGPGFAKNCERWTEELDGRSHPVFQHPGSTGTEQPPFVVPPGHVFVMGDNRDNSNDSRAWKQDMKTVPEDLIKGRALIIWWSRGPISEGFSLKGVGEWFSAIRWSRLFDVVR